MHTPSIALRTRTVLVTLSVLAGVTLTACGESTSEKRARRALEKRHGAPPEDAFLLVAAAGDAESLKPFLRAGLDVDVTNKYGDTPLMLAVRTHPSGSDPAKVRLLLEAGADVNARNRRGRSALQDAVTVADVSVARLLLEHGADVGLDGERGARFVGMARGADSPELVDLLLAAGAVE